MSAQFDLLKRLGAGHFGEVWLAMDTSLNVRRALKLIPPDKVLNKTNFFHEAQILKAAEHPNVVRVEETGTFGDGRIYVAMEYLSKGSLEDEASGAYVALTRAKRLMIDVLRGLEYAHSKGILHRDIKPANILVGHTFEGKLSDFGLAIPAGYATRAIGVKDYAYIFHLAPESHTGNYSTQSDIYACGVTLYRLVNGDRYLPSLSPADIIKQSKLGKYPDRSSYRDFIPRPLRALINKALQIDPAERFQSAEDLRHALEQININMNWQESTSSQGRKWMASWDDKCYEIERVTSPNNKWEISVRKGKSKRSLRMVNALCRSNLSKTKAEQETRRLLQDFVLGRLQ